PPLPTLLSHTLLLVIPPSPRSTLFPYTTLFRSISNRVNFELPVALYAQPLTPYGIPMLSANRILEGVRILAFTTGYAGPYAGRLLAGYGAEVIKIESRKGGLDTFRHYGQHKDIDAAPRFIECNLGVRSLAVNLKHPTGARLIRELAAKSDAILQNFRPRVLDKLGLGDDELRKLNPKLVIVKMPGF